jgi:hypothetical protein
MRKASTIAACLVCLFGALRAEPRQQRSPARAGAPQAQKPGQTQQRRGTLDARGIIEGALPSTGKSGIVVRADSREPIEGARVRQKPLEIPNAFDKPCKASTGMDGLEGPSVATNKDGKFVLSVASVPAPALSLPARTRPATAEDETARRILELEQMRRLAESGIQVVDQQNARNVRLPQQTVDQIRVPATVPLAERTEDGGGLVAEHDGFVMAPSGGIPTSDGMTLELAPAPTLSGRILDVYNRPVAAAVVQVYEVRIRPLGRMMKWVKSTLTNDLGEYRVPYLPYGWYTIAVGHSTYVQQPWRDTLKLSPNLPAPDEGLSLLFYPGVENASDAQLIHIKPIPPGMPQPIASMALRERQRFNVKVRLGADSIPSNANLVVVPAGGDVCATMDYAIKSNRDGTFDVRDLPRGRYEMVVISGRDVISALMPINVEKNIDDLKIPLTRPTSVKGTVFFEDLPSGIDVNLLLGEIRVNLTRSRAEVSQVATTVADSRTFNFSIPGLGPGFYYPTLTLPPGAYVKDIDVAGIEHAPGAAEDDWKCNALPGGTYSYLDLHGHLEALEIPRDLATSNPDVSLCLKVLVGFAGQIGGPLRPAPPPPPSFLVVAMPRSVWGNYSDNGVTPPDRILVRSRWQMLGVPSGDYRVYGIPSESAELIYRKEFSEWFSAWATSVFYETVSPCPVPNDFDICAISVTPQSAIDQVVP